MAYVTARNSHGSLVMWVVVAVVAAGCLRCIERKRCCLFWPRSPGWTGRCAVRWAPVGRILDEALLLGAMVAILFSTFFLKRSLSVPFPRSFPGCGRGVAVTSVVVNQVPDHVAQFRPPHHLSTLSLLPCRCWCPKDRRWVRAAVVVFLAGCVLLALHGLYQYVSGAPMPASWVDTHEDIGTRPTP